MKIRRMLNRLIESSGYTIAKAGPLYSVPTRGEAFDYAGYREAQQETNLRKIEQTWATEENIAFAARYIQSEIGAPAFGICHGTRRGEEQAWFRAHLGCEVIGTEISDSAQDFPHTVQWDFHDENPEWLGKADFVYSNALDHSYDPAACLRTWVGSLRVGGLCVLEHEESGHSPQNMDKADLFGARIEAMPWLIALWGRDAFFLKEMLDAPQGAGRRFLIVERRK